MTLSFHYTTHRRKSQYILCFFAIFLSIISVVLAPLSASARSSIKSSSSAQNFYFEDFTADYYLSRDADGTSRMRVKEQLTAVFPDTDQNHGISRIIPFTNNDGKNITMPSTSRLDIAVQRNGVDEPIANITSENGYFEVRIGDADEYVHGRQIYTLEYEFENLILDQTSDGKSWQELYWDINGNDWDQRFNQVTARIHLADDVAKHFTGEVACYVGRYGESGSSRCKVAKEGNVVTFTALKLSAGETLTIVMGFKADSFVVHAPATSYLLVHIARIFIAMSALIIILSFVASHRVKAKRDYYRGLFIKPEYTAPRGFTVAEMAENYIGKGLKGNPKVATLLELAVTHKVELVKTETTGAFGKQKTSWQVHVLSTKGLTDEQIRVLQILNGKDKTITDGQSISIKPRTANSTLQSLAQQFTAETKDSLRKKSLYVEKSAKPKGLNATFMIAISIVWLCVTMVAFFATIIIPDESYIHYAGSSWVPFCILPIGFVAFLTVILKATKTLRFEERTEKGLDYSRYLDGLKLYISMAEADRLAFLQSVKGADTSHAGVVKLYEKLLPYAALFGLEKSWLNELSRYYEFDDVAAPIWYIGPGTFSPRDFNSTIRSFTSTAGTSIVHSTTVNSSSSGSGFSGGFSGGGGGGGGGGGW